MSKKPMDYLPLIPGSDGTQNAARPIRDAFQDILDGELYPKKVAEYVVTCQVDQDLKIKENAEQVLQIYDSLNDNMEVIDNAGRELMEQQGLYYIRKDTIDDLDDLKEKIRLKHCGLFKPLKMFFVDYFGLLQRSDLLPPAVKKSVDFRLNENLHLCEDCCVDSSNRKKLKAASVVKCNKLRCVEERKFLTSHELNTKLDSKDFIADERPREWKRSLQTDKPKTKVAPRNQFVLMPRSIEFINCDPGKTYKATVKLLNTGTSIQTLVIKDYPKQRSISIELDLKSKLASGMSCVGTITYKPDVYRNFNELITIRNQLGTVQSIEIRVFRPSPRLIICVIRSNSSHMDRPRPGSARFLEARREALNSTIDCGSCLVGQCVSVSVFVQNTGIRGKFFIITEDEWYSENIQTITTHMEHSCEYLWIYPTFFELNAEETTEINMLFHPSRPDMYLEKFFFICDNNSFQQFEVIGDGFLFKKSYINIDIYPVTNIEDKEDYCIFLGFFKPFNVVSFIITVHNTSSLMLKCLWKFRNKKMKDMCQIDESCIDIENCPSHLAPYCTADFTFKINFDDDGFYSTFFNFFITGVPAISLDKDETFLIGKKENSEEMLTKVIYLNYLQKLKDIKKILYF